MFFDFAQIVGIVGFLIGVSAYLSKNDAVLKFLIGLASCFIAYHLFLLTAYVGAGAALFSAARSFISIFQRLKPFAPLFFLAYLPLGYFLIEDWLDVLPIIAGLVGTYSMFYLEKLPMRYGLFVATFFWFLHNLLQGSIGGTMLELFYMGANVVTILRLKKEGKGSISPPV